MPEMIMDEAQGRALFLDARREFARLTRLAVQGEIKLRLVGQADLKRAIGHAARDGHDPHAAHMVERGYYQRVENIIVERNFFGRETGRRHELQAKTIYLLFPSRRDVLLSTAIHELTHDYLAEHHPAWAKAPLWSQEGLCQLSSAMYCRHHGFADSLDMIEHSPDAIYGDGYRYFKRKFGELNDWAEVHEWLRKNPPGVLPAKAPTLPAR